MFTFGLYSVSVVGGVGVGSTTSRPVLGSSLLGGVPAPPTNLQAVITSTRFLTLAWEPPEPLAGGGGSGEITGYSVFYKQRNSER